MTEPFNTNASPAKAAPPARVTDPIQLAEVLALVASSGPISTERLIRFSRFRHDVYAAFSKAKPSSLRNELVDVLREFELLQWIEHSERGWQLSAGVAKNIDLPSLAPSRFALELCLAHQRKNKQIIGNLLTRMWLLNPRQQGVVPLDAPELYELLTLRRGHLLAEGDSNASHVTNPILLTEESTTPSPEKPSRRRLWDNAVERLLEQAFGDVCSTRDLRIWQMRMDFAGLTMTTQTLRRVRAPQWFCAGSFSPRAYTDSTLIAELALEGEPFWRHTPAGLEAENRFADTVFATYCQHLQTSNTEFGSLLRIRDDVCFDLRIGNDVFQSLLQRTLVRAITGDLPYMIALDVDVTSAERRHSELTQPVIIDNSPRYLISMRRRPVGDDGGTQP